MAESEEELKSLLTKMKDESEKVGLKLNIQKLRSWQPVPSLHGKQMGKQWKQVTNFIFVGSKITVDGDCSHEIKRHLLLRKQAPWKKSYGKPRHPIKKQRHYFADKGPYSQSYGFSSNHAWM